MARPVVPKSGRLRGVVLRAVPWVGLAAMTALWARAKRKPIPGLSVDAVATPEHFEITEPGRGRMATMPHHIPWQGWRDIIWRTSREIGADRLTAVAGGVTFYALLAVFPAVGVFVSLYGLIADISQVSSQLRDLAAFVPQGVLVMIGDQMVRLALQQQATLSLAFIVSLLFSLWTANAGMSALVDGLNVAYDENEKRNFALRRALTFGFTVGALVFMTIVTALLVAAPPVLEFLGVGAWLIPLRWLVLLVLAAGAFATIYRYGPSRQRAKWRWVTWGGAAASLGWVLGSLGFSWYVNNVAHYNVTYGSLGAVIGFMMWIWFSVMVVLVGAELNAEIEHQTAIDSTTGAPMPMGERGAAMADSVGLKFVGVRRGFSLLRGGLSRQMGRLRKRDSGDTGAS